MHFSPDGGQRQRLSFMKTVGFCVGNPTRCTQQREQGFTAALAQVRVLPEIEPFFHGVGFAIIGPQSLITHGGGVRARDGRLRGSGCRARFAAARGRLLGCGLFRVHDRWGIRKTWGLPGCVDADAPHVVVLGALSTSAYRPVTLASALWMRGE